MELVMNRTSILNRATTASSVLTALHDGNAISASAVSGAIKRIAGMGGKLDNLIHGTAVACIHLSMSIEEGGPASGAGPAERLMNAMGKASRAKTLARWFAEYSNLRLTYDTKAKTWKGGVLHSKLKGYAIPRPAEALATPFWTEAEHVPAGAFNDASFANAVASLIKRASKDGVVLSPDMQAKLAALRALDIKLPEASPANDADDVLNRADVA